MDNDITFGVLEDDQLISHDEGSPGAFVRISREHQRLIDAELIYAAKFSETTKTPRRGRKRQMLSSNEDEPDGPLPQSIRVNAAMMRRLMTKFFEISNSQCSISEFNVYAERIEQIWCDINAEWTLLAGQKMSAAALNICSTFFAEVMDEYLKFKAQHREHLLQDSNATSISSPSDELTATRAADAQVIQIQLSEPPKIPKFSGLEVDWANFRAVFENEVHKNSRFSNTQKMSYLLGALQGRAAQAYSNWPIMGDSSYELLWSEICSQYSNEYNTIRAHLLALNKLRPMQQPTREAIHHIIDVARGSFRQLQLILKPEQMGEYMLLHQLESLLDIEGRMQWNLRRSTETVPTLVQMFNFLQWRASTLDSQATTSLLESRNESQRNALINKKSFSQLVQRG